MKKIDSCQYLRCLCVICVFLSHIPFLNINGQFGVALFMLMSGFFTMMSANNNRFSLKKRFIRIAPLYWILTVTLFILALLKPNILNFTEPTLHNLLFSLLFIPYYVKGAGHKPILNVGWYLNVEIFFTILFAISYKFNKKHSGNITIIIIFLLFIIGQLFGFKNNILEAYTKFYIVYYAIGIIMFYLYKKYFERIDLPINKYFLNIFLLLVYLVGLLFFQYNFIFLVYTIVYYVVFLLLRPVIFKKLFVSIGNNSYAFYLLHYFIIAIIDRFLYRLNNLNVYSFLITILCFFITYLISIFVTKYMDKINEVIKKGVNFLS